jgi:hypothetical protein
MTINRLNGHVIDSSLETALAYLAAGLSVLPANRERKYPVIPAWREYQSRLPTEAEVRGWFSDSSACHCLICGAASGNLYCLDFDSEGEVYAEWRRRVADLGGGELLPGLAIERTPSGGFHVVWRCAETAPPSRKIARKVVPVPCEGEHDYAKKKLRAIQTSGGWVIHPLLVESKGAGGLILCDPSPHYELQQGAFTDLPILDAAQSGLLIEAAESFNEVFETSKTAPLAERVHRERQPGELTPGDDYNQRGDVAALLSSHGWQFLGQDSVNQYWKRPGKTTAGCSASLRIVDSVFRCYSTSTILDSSPTKGYGPFQLFTALEAAGDFAEAARRLRGYGYGSVEWRDPAAIPLFDFSGQLNALTDPGDDPLPSRIEDPGQLPPALLESLPGLLGDLVRWNLETARQPQPELALGAALALIGTITGRKISDDGGTRTNIYCVGVAGSACGKEHARKRNKEALIRGGSADLIAPEGVHSGSAVVSLVEHRPSVLIQIDEIGRFLGGANSLQASTHLRDVPTILLTMFTSSDSVYLGAAHADRDKDKSIEQPNLCLYGTTVQESLMAALTPTNISDGLMGRMLFFRSTRGYQRPASVRQFSCPDSISETIGWWREYSPGGNLGSTVPQPRILETSDGAAEQFEGLADLAFGHECGEHKEYAPLWRRAVEQARKLALIFTASADREATSISAYAAAWGCGVVAHLIRDMVFLADRHMSDGNHDANCKRLLRLIETAGERGLTTSALCRAARGVTPRDRSTALADLQAGGLILQESIGTAGRPRTVWRLPGYSQSSFHGKNFDEKGLENKANP